MRGHAIDGVQREDDALAHWQLVKHGVNGVSCFADFRRSLRGLAFGWIGREVQRMVSRPVKTAMLVNHDFKAPAKESRCAPAKARVNTS